MGLTMEELLPYTEEEANLETSSLLVFIITSSKFVVMKSYTLLGHSYI